MMGHDARPQLLVVMILKITHENLGVGDVMSTPKLQIAAVVSAEDLDDEILLRSFKRAMKLAALKTFNARRSSADIARRSK